MLLLAATTVGAVAACRRLTAWKQALSAAVPGAVFRGRRWRRRGSPRFCGVQTLESRILPSTAGGIAADAAEEFPDHTFLLPAPAPFAAGLELGPAAARQAATLVDTTRWRQQTLPIPPVDAYRAGYRPPLADHSDLAIESQANRPLESLRERPERKPAVESEDDRPAVAKPPKHRDGPDDQSALSPARNPAGGDDPELGPSLEQPTADATVTGAVDCFWTELCEALRPTEEDRHDGPSRRGEHLVRAGAEPDGFAWSAAAVLLDGAPLASVAR